MQSIDRVALAVAGCAIGWLASIGLMAGARPAHAATAAASVNAAAAAPVDAARALRLAKLNACFGCHQVNGRLVGPAFAEIAARYRGDAAAAARLQAKVLHGGVGVWGQIPMPSHPAMAPADIKLVVDWVLAGAPSS